MTLLAELAHCLSLFPNLHTVQIDVDLYSRQLSFGKIFERTFKKYSYPQIRNVLQYTLRCILPTGTARRLYARLLNVQCLQTIMRICSHLEVVLEAFGDVDLSSVALFFSPSLAIALNLKLEVLTISHSQVVVNYLPNLRTIQFMIFPLEGGDPSHVCPIRLCEDSANSLVL